MTRFAPRRTSCAFLALLAGCGWLGEDEPTGPVVPSVEIASFSPTGELPVTQRVEVRFSEAMVGAELVGQDRAPDDVVVVTPDLGGRGRWIAPDTFVLEPGRPLRPNTRYVARVRSRVAGPGRRLVGQRRFTFRTPLFRVLSAQARPAGAAVMAVIELSHAVRSDDASGAVSFQDRDGRVLPARLLGSGLQTILRFSLTAADLDPDEGITMRIEPTLTPDCGGAALDKAVIEQLTFASPPPPAPVGADVRFERTGPVIRVRLDADVDSGTARAFVRTEPVTRFSIEPAHLGFVMRGAIRPGTQYRILLREGLPTQSGALEAEAELEVAVPNLPPSIDLDAAGPFLMADADTLSVDVVNVERLLVRAIRVPDRNIAFIDPSADQAPDSLGRVVAERQVSGTARRDERASVELPLSSLLRAGRGLYRIELEDVDRAWVRTGGWLVQKSLRSSAKVGRNYLRAEVRRASGGAKVANARVSAYSRTGRRLFDLGTDARGIAEYIGPIDPEDPVAWVVAHADKASAYLPLEASRIPLPSLDTPAHASAFVWTARDYLRPGETLHAFGLQEGGMQSGLRFELLGPEGPVGAPMTPEFGGGLARGEMVLPPDLTPGVYTVRLVDAAGGRRGAVRVRVVDGTPPVLTVKVAPVGAGARVGGPVPFSVAVRSRFGSRTAGFRIEGRCRYTPLEVTAPAASGFDFGVSAADYAVGPEVSARPATLGDDGRAQVECPPPPSDLPLGHRVQVDLQVTVYEPGGRPAEGAGSAVVDAAERYVGLRPTESGVEALVLERGGQVEPGISLVARITEVSKRSAGAAPVRRARLTSGAGPVAVPATLDRAGRYRAELESAEGRLLAAREFWVLTGTAAAGVRHVDVRLPDEPVAVGASVTARLTVPFSGRAKITVERDRVIYETSSKVTAPYATVTLPVLASFAPNANLVVTLEGARGQRAHGAAVLRLRPEERQLDVQFDLPDGSRAGRFPLTFRVQGASGPVHAIATVVSTPRWSARGADRRDAFAYLTTPRPASMRTYETDGLGPTSSPEARAFPVEALDAPPVPSSVPAASEAYVSKIVRVSPQGYGWIAVRPPTGGGRATLSLLVFDGRAARRVLIPLDREGEPVLRLSAPSALVPGDAVQVPLTVENDSADELVATASIGVSAGLVVRGAATRSVRVPAGRSRTVKFSVEASRPGPSEIRAAVTAPGGRWRAFSKVMVRTAGAPVARGVSASVTQRRPGKLAVPSSRGAARLIVGPGRIYRFLPAFDAVWHAEPEGVAAAISRGRAVLAFPRLARREGRAPPVEGPQLAADLATVQGAVDGEGRLALWRDGPTAAATLQVQAALLVAEAMRAGRRVDAGAWRKLERGARAVVQDARIDLRTRAIGLYALARARARGYAEPTDLEAAKSPAVRALLAAARFAAGRAKGGRALLEGDFTPTGEAAVDAWTLLALATVVPGHPAVAPLAAKLEGAVEDGRWATPEVNATALVALARMHAVRAAGRPYWGTVFSGGKVLKRFNSTRIMVLEAPASVWSAGLDITVTGAGEAHAGLSVVGADERAAKPLDEGLTLTRQHVSAAAPKGPGGQAELGTLWATQVTLTGPKGRGAGTPVVVQVPVPAGFVVEQVWPDEVFGLSAAPSGAIETTPEGLQWQVLVGDSPVRLVFTTRAVRAGKFVEPPIRAWQSDAPLRRSRTAPLIWTVSGD